jgi:hypothetical protein
VLGVLIAVTGYVAAEGGEIGTVPWRALVLLLAAILFFGSRCATSAWCLRCSCRSCSPPWPGATPGSCRPR